MKKTIKIFAIIFALVLGASIVLPAYASKVEINVEGSQKDDKKKKMGDVVGPNVKRQETTPAAQSSKKTASGKKKTRNVSKTVRQEKSEEDTTPVEVVGEDQSLWQGIGTIVTENKPKEVRPTINPIYKVEAVDLGLSVEWADRNLGADTPQECGNYYAWGEIKPKTSFKWSNYLEGRVSAKADCGTDKDPLKGFVAPYNRDLSYKNDAATMSLGGDWRMPSKAEFRELELECTWQWVEKDGYAGSKVTGPNGNSIFIPASGWSDSENYQVVKNVKTDGYYWSSTASVVFPESAYEFNNFNGKTEKGVNAGMTECRYMGLTIRAVRSK